MPKDEFDFEDPLELNGVALLTEEDTTDAMCECFIEEFLRMGYTHKQVLALFRNPNYLGMHMVLQNRGEPFVRDQIAEIFARWGRAVTWTDAIPIPLTPALSHGERENHRQSVLQSGAPPSTTSRSAVLPLSEGEGRGEGEEHNLSSQVHSQEVKLDSSFTDPMGAAIPKLNL